MKKVYEEPTIEWILLTSEEEITTLPGMSGYVDPEDDPFSTYFSLNPNAFKGETDASKGFRRFR